MIYIYVVDYLEESEGVINNGKIVEIKWMVIFFFCYKFEIKLFFLILDSRFYFVWYILGFFKWDFLVLFVVFFYWLFVCIKFKLIVNNIVFRLVCWNGY